MAAVTLTTLRARARERADMVNSAFVTDGATSVDAFVNEGCQILHEMLVTAYEEEYVSSSYSTTTTGAGLSPQVSDYPLPTDFFKLYGVTLTSGGVDRTLRPYMRTERAIYKDPRFIPNRLPRYSIVGSVIRLLPVPLDGLGLTFLYAPVFTPLVLPTDTCNFPNGWERYVVAYAAMQLLLKEETDTTVLGGVLEKLERDIQAVKHQRDAASPKQAVDIDMSDNDWDFRRGWT